MSAENEKVVNLSASAFMVSPAAMYRMLAVLATIGFAALSLGVKVALFSHEEVTKANTRLERIEGRLTDRWTLSMQRKYTDDLARKNPMVTTPDPDEIAMKLQIR